MMQKERFLIISIVILLILLTLNFIITYTNLSNNENLDNKIEQLREQLVNIEIINLQVSTSSSENQSRLTVAFENTGYVDVKSFSVSGNVFYQSSKHCDCEESEELFLKNISNLQVGDKEGITWDICCHAIDYEMTESSIQFHDIILKTLG